MAGSHSSLLRGAVFLLAMAPLAAVDSGQAGSSLVDPVPGPIISALTAAVSSGGLRMRTFPGREGRIICTLDKNDHLTVQSKTSWRDQIDGITAPWYEVAKGWAAGWCFGGYLAVDNQDAVPVSPLRRGEKKLLHSYFEGAEGRNLGPLPYLAMKIFGIETPYDIPSRDGFDSAYDRINKMVFLELSPAPERVLRVSASDPHGNAFKADLLPKSDPSFQTIEANEQGFTYSKPVTAFRFRAPANSSAGDWTFIAVPDGRTSAMKKVRITVDAASATLSASAHPNPFDYPAWVSAKPQDTLFLFGSNAGPRTAVKIAFYQLTQQQNEDLSFKMKPSVAGEVMSDASGRYRVILHIGSDLSPGQYKFGSGEDGMEINLFDVFLSVE